MAEQKPPSTEPRTYILYTNHPKARWVQYNRPSAECHAFADTQRYSAAATCHSWVRISHMLASRNFSRPDRVFHRG
jgi:hypothetical protein